MSAEPQAQSPADAAFAYDTEQQQAASQQQTQAQQAFETGRARQAFMQSVMRGRVQQGLRENALGQTLAGAAPQPTRG